MLPPSIPAIGGIAVEVPVDAGIGSVDAGAALLGSCAGFDSPHAMSAPHVVATRNRIETIFMGASFGSVRGTPSHETIRSGYDVRVAPLPRRRHDAGMHRGLFAFVAMNDPEPVCGASGDSEHSVERAIDDVRDLYRQSGGLPIDVNDPAQFVTCVNTDARGPWADA
jgi:hypothetical protein